MASVEPYWQSADGRHVLYCGDCLAILPTLEAGSVDAVVTDPPYGMSFQSAWRIESERFAKIANDEQPFIWWCPQAARVVCDAGCVLTFCRWDDAEAFRLALGWASLRVRSQLVWDRGNHGLGDLYGAPAPRHDTIWFAVKGRFQFHDRRPPSVLTHMRLAGDALEHPNEKPLALMVCIAGDYCPPDGQVLDPFAGSGTTGVACIQTGRRFIGIEIDPKYCAIAANRMEKAIADKASELPFMREPEPEQTELFATDERTT